MGDERDPLLVRPFVLPDGAQQEPPPSASTWPVEQRAGEMPTQLLPTIAGTATEEPGPGSAKPDRRRHVVLLSGAAAVAVATFTGYALLRSGDQLDSWTSMPRQSLPAAVGPDTTSRATPGETHAREGGSNVGGAGGTTSPPLPARASATPVAGGTVSPDPPATPPTASPSSTASSTAPVAPIVPVAPIAPAAPIDVSPTPVATGSGLLVAGTGLCLDLRGGTAVEGSDVEIDECSEAGSQRWKLNADRTLQVLGMCIHLAVDGTVELAGCDGRATAQWRLLSDGILTNAANGQCLTDPYLGVRPGNTVIVTTCVGGNNQRWSFR